MKYYDLKSTLAMIASETSLVIDSAVSLKLIHQVDSFLTGLTLLCCPSKSCHSFFFFCR